MKILFSIINIIVLLLTWNYFINNDPDHYWHIALVAIYYYATGYGRGYTQAEVDLKKEIE
jgi:galactitol-specific phosphotransferase system IIC component